jgi:hypothetical protein
VCKTIDDARVTDAPAQEATTDAQTASWVEWIDGRIDGWIEQEKDAILEAVGEALAQLLDKASADTQRALDKRDRELEGLRREIKLLRDEVGLERGLAKLKVEVAKASESVSSLGDGVTHSDALFEAFYGKAGTSLPWPA